MQGNKFVNTLQSRKFWAAMISVAVSLGVIDWMDAQQGEIVDSLVTIAAALVPVISGAVYIISTAVEDAAHAKNKPGAKQ